MRDLVHGRSATALLCAALLIAAAFVGWGDPAAGAFGAKTASPKRIAAVAQTALDVTAPSKPGRIRIEATSTTSVTISWRRSTDRVGVAGYILYRDGTRVGTTSASTLRYLFYGLACGTSYQLGIEAYDIAGNRSARATILAPTSACVDTQAPSAPPSVTPSGVTAQSISVTWAAASDNVGIVGYEVLRDGALAGSTASTQYALASLQCGTMYTVGVRAFDASGNRSAPASILVATTSCPDTTAPTDPEGLSATGSNETSITVQWQPSSDANGVAGYGVYRDGNYSGSTSGTSYTVAGLSCGSSYSLSVEAYDAAGNRSGRASLQASTSVCPPPPAPAPPADTTAPTAPTGLAATGATSSSISLRWDASSDNSGVAGYGLYRDGTAAGSVALTNATFSGLTCGRSYQLSVDAYDASGNRSSRSSVVSSTAPCPDTTPPSTPAGLTQTSSTESTIGFGWSASTDNVGVAGYGVYLGGVRVATTSSPGYTFASLSCGTTYTVGVDAYDAAGGRSAQAALVVSTRSCPSDTQAPSVPQNQTLGGFTASSFTMSWSASSDNVGVSGYALYLNGTRVATTSATSYTYTSLACGTTYTVGLEAFDAAGNASNVAYASGPASTSACPSSGDTQAPSAPAAVTVGTVSQTSVAVSWSAASDNVGVTGYGYYRGGSLVGNGTGTSYTFSGLACGTNYTFAVDAVDAAGNRSSASSVGAATSACSGSPAPPSGTANLWVDASGGSCARQSTPGAYADAQACSWNQAYQASQTGDLILVKGGSYGDVTIGPNRTSISAPGVTFRTASGETVVVSDVENGHIAGGTGGSNITFVGPVSARSFRSDRASNVVVDGWNVDCNGCSGEQIFHLEAASNVIVRNSEIQDNNNNSLIWISGSNLTFENNRIHDAGLPSGSSAHTECLYAWDVTNLTLKRNHFWHCSVMDVFITGSDVANGGYIENNIFEKPWSNTGQISNSAFAFHFRNGGSPSPDPSNWDFRYNTFVGPLSITTSENPVGPGGMRVIGNVFLSGSPCGQSNATYSYNAFVGSGCGTNTVTGTLSSFMAGFAASTDPGNYSLTSTSPLRDKGSLGNYPSQDRTGTSRYTGAAPDIGAYEGS